MGFVLEAGDVRECLWVSVGGGGFPELFGSFFVSGCLASHCQIGQRVGEPVLGGGSRVVFCLLEKFRFFSHHGQVAQTVGAPFAAAW
ncbi:hypothetical protein [Streptomyces sp. NPDC054834]